LWKKICKMCIDPAPGNVDFKTEMLIVAALGEHSGAYQSTVDSLTVVDGVMEIVVRKSVAGPNCVITTGNMQPIEVVRVQKSNCTARFIRVTEEHAC
jgi:hypothetical protein